MAKVEHGLETRNQHIDFIAFLAEKRWFRNSATFLRNQQLGWRENGRTYGERIGNLETGSFRAGVAVTLHCLKTGREWPCATKQIAKLMELSVATISMVRNGRCGYGR